MPALCDFSSLNRSNYVGLCIVEKARFSILTKSLLSLRTNRKDYKIVPHESLAGQQDRALLVKEATGGPRSAWWLFLPWFNIRQNLIPVGAIDLRWERRFRWV